MENIDIIILTSVVVVAFLVFIITSVREFMNMNRNGYQYNPNEKVYGRDALFNVLENIFNDDTISKDSKKEIIKTIERTIADMETDGVYFTDDVIEKMQKEREELHCHYSGLPSVKSYDLS
jgi:Zn-dependent oligopeptidase